MEPFYNYSQEVSILYVIPGHFGLKVLRPEYPPYSLCNVKYSSRLIMKKEEFIEDIIRIRIKGVR